jgi:hypothetical protein
MRKNLSCGNFNMCHRFVVLCAHPSPNLARVMDPKTRDSRLNQYYVANLSVVATCVYSWPLAINKHAKIDQVYYLEYIPETRVITTTCAREQSLNGNPQCSIAITA